MATLLLRFPGGRYHATPWGHHVNEALIEWPPSPWRLMRALIACGYAKHGWSAVPPAARRLIDALSNVLPFYRLPAATVAHSRHYMPTGVLEKGRERPTLVFDAWADVGDEPLFVRWDCRLDDEAVAMFERLASSLGYLGRSESWVVADVVPDAHFPLVRANAYPHVEGRRSGREWEQITLMAPEPGAGYDEWRRSAVATALESLPLPADKARPSKKLLDRRARAEAPYPADLVECLQRDTNWCRLHRWSRPPGSRRVLYWRRADALTVAPPVAPRRGTAKPVSMFLLALTTPGGSTSALPSVSRVLPQAELLHRALVARIGRAGAAECPELTGRDVGGRPLGGPHRHAHLIPVDLDSDHRIDHILIHALMGLHSAAQSAVHGLERTWTKGGVGELRIAVAASGGDEDLRRLPPPLDAGISALLGPMGGARIWRSRTPFVAPRHLKKKGVNTLENQVLSELDSRGLPAAQVELLPWDSDTQHFRHVVRVRRYPAPSPPTDAGFALRLTFEVPVAGPIAIGYGSHFGLGLFAADDER